LPLEVVEGRIYVQIEIKLDPPITEEQLWELIEDLDEGRVVAVKPVSFDKINGAVIEFWAGEPEGVVQAIKELQEKFDRRYGVG